METSEPIVLIDSKGKLRIVLGIFNDVPSLCFLDHDGNQRLGMELDKHGNPNIVFSDHPGHPRINIRIQDEAARIFLQAASGGPNFLLEVCNNQNLPQIKIRDNSGNVIYCPCACPSPVRRAESGGRDTETGGELNADSDENSAAKGGREIAE